MLVYCEQLVYTFTALDRTTTSKMFRPTLLPVQVRTFCVIFSSRLTTTCHPRKFQDKCYLCLSELKPSPPRSSTILTYKPCVLGIFVEQEIYDNSRVFSQQFDTVCLRLRPCFKMKTICHLQHMECKFQYWRLDGALFRFVEWRFLCLILNHFTVLQIHYVQIDHLGDTCCDHLVSVVNASLRGKVVSILWE